MHKHHQVLKSAYLGCKHEVGLCQHAWYESIMLVAMIGWSANFVTIEVNARLTFLYKHTGTNTPWKKALQ